MTGFIDRYAQSRDPIEALARARRDASERGLDPRHWLAYSVMVRSVVPHTGVTDQARQDGTSARPTSGVLN
jgi:hypothetical protein